MDEKTYYVNFWGWCEIEASSEEEAKVKFWEYVMNEKALPKNIYEIFSANEKA